MTERPTLSDAEWELVTELLERERGELPVEIHHCRVTNYREELLSRQRLVEGLLERLQEHATT